MNDYKSQSSEKETIERKGKKIKNNNQKNKRYIPLMVSISDKKVVIFGGGSVAERKALRFMNYSNVVLYSPDFTDELKKAAAENKIKLVETALKPQKEIIEPILKDAFLAIPATSDLKLNLFVVKLSKEKNILVNSVDDANEVIIPSTVEAGGLTISISSMGLSPAVTKLARMRIEKVITDDFEHMIFIQNELRNYLKENVDDQRERQKIIWEVLDSEEVWKEIKVSKDSALKKAFFIADEKIKTIQNKE